MDDRAARLQLDPRPRPLSGCKRRARRSRFAAQPGLLRRPERPHGDRESAAEDDILIVSGSNQGIDLVNAALLARGDTVIIEKLTYQGTLTRLARRGATMVEIPLDRTHGQSL